MIMKLHDNRKSSIPSESRQPTLIQKNVFNQENILFDNNINFKKKNSMSNFYSHTNRKFKSNTSKGYNLNYNLFPQDLRMSINSSINFNDDNKFLFEDKLNLKEKNQIVIPKKMKPKNDKDTFIIQNLHNKSQTKSMKGSYYKRKNNSVIIMKENKDFNSLFHSGCRDLNKIESIYSNQASRKMKNVTLEHLKDLLDIKINKEEKTEEEVVPYSDNFSSILNPLEVYLERTRADNQRNLLKKEDMNKMKEKRNKGTKKNSLDNNYIINEDAVILNSDRGVNIEENRIIWDKVDVKRSLFHENISNGVQYGLEQNYINSPISNNENFIYEDHDPNQLFTRKIISNAKLRENIKWEKLQPKDENDLVHKKFYSSEFFEAKNEIFKLYFENRINYLDSRFKLKTPNDLKSKIGNQNKINDIKKVSSAKPTKFINKIFLNSYAKEKDIIHDKSENNIYDNNTNQTNKEFWEFKNVVKGSKLNDSKKKMNNVTCKENVLKSINIHDKMKIIKKSVYSPVNNNIIVFKNIAYNLKNEENNNPKDPKPNSLILNCQNNKMDGCQKTNEGLKVHYDNNCNENETYRNFLLIDNCNTSNGFNNLAEYNSMERKNISKHFNSSKKIFSRFNKIDCNDEEDENKKQLNKRLFIEKKEFLDRVNWKENKSIKIIKGGKSASNYIGNSKYLKELIEDDLKQRKSINKCVPNVTTSQYYIDDTSKYKFKVLKKQLLKESERVFNLIDDLKRVQCDLIDSKRKFLIESTDNKLKKFTRYSKIVPV